MAAEVLRELEELKKSIGLAHQNNQLTQTQVSGCIQELKSNNSRISDLEGEIKSMRAYLEAIEEYCVSLDIAVRKHHLMLSGVAESKDESVNLTTLRVLQTCFSALEITDIDYSYRIGAFNTSKKGGDRRPILVKQVREVHRRDIFKNRQALGKSDVYSKVYINEDLPQIINDRRADVRAVYANAIEKKQPAKMAGTRVTVNNVTYKHNKLDNLPEGLRLVDKKIVQVHGGVALSSDKAYLNIFYPCKFKINGQLFDSAEKAYQYARAMNMNAPEIARQVYDAISARACKKLSYNLLPTDEWDREKRGIMKLIVQEKFEQNEDIKVKLLATGSDRLIEATTDMYWGAGVHIGSKLLKSGKWTGRNELGAILGEVREDLRRTEAWKQSKGSDSNEGTNDASSDTIRQQQLLSFVPPDQVDLIQQLLAKQGPVLNKGPHATNKGKGKNKSRAGRRNKSKGVNSQPHDPQNSMTGGSSQSAGQSLPSTGPQSQPPAHSGNPPAGNYTSQNQVQGMPISPNFWNYFPQAMQAMQFQNMYSQLPAQMQGQAPMGQFMSGQMPMNLIQMPNQNMAMLSNQPPPQPMDASQTGGSTQDNLGIGTYTNHNESMCFDSGTPGEATEGTDSSAPNTGGAVIATQTSGPGNESVNVQNPSSPQQEVIAVYIGSQAI